MNKKYAHTIATETFIWLSKKPETLSSFLESTGIEPHSIRGSVENLEFLASVIDFILTSDELVIEASNHANITPNEFMLIRAALPGGDIPTWT